MPVSNVEVADLLRRYAATLVIEGADRFKVKAYRRAAETIESHERDVAELVASGEDLTKLPGVGKAISDKVKDIVGSGRLAQLDRSVSKLSPELLELSTRPQLDPKVVMRAYKKLGIGSLTELQDKLDAGDVRELLGPRVEFQLRQGLDDRPRMLLYHAEPIAAKIEKFLRAIEDVEQVAAVGSLRRKQDTVGDLNFLVAGDDADAVLEAFQRFPGAKPIAEPARNGQAFQLSTGTSVHLRVVKADAWGLELVRATGSQAHVKQLEQRAKKKRLPTSAAALARKGINTADETSIYRALGLDFIEPELREGRGEVEAAEAEELPPLVSLEDLRGDLHMHTKASDGVNTLAQMAAAARARGYQYIAITDHSQSLKITNGLTEKRLLAQIRAIDKFNEQSKGILVLKSAEVDILDDGSLDYSDGVLKELDLTICSIHSKFALDQHKQTERIMRAMDNPHFNILGHATGRLLLKREGYEIDMERIIEHAQANGCFFEINSSPDRLDVSDLHARMAKEAGIKIAVNTDAHSVDELNFISAGINQARRAWLEPADVLNTLPWTKLRRVLKR